MYGPAFTGGMCHEDAYGEMMSETFRGLQRHYERKGYCSHRTDFVEHSEDEVECEVCGKTWHPEMYKHEQAKKRRYRRAAFPQPTPKIAEEEFEDLPF